MEFGGPEETTTGIEVYKYAINLIWQDDYTIKIGQSCNCNIVPDSGTLWNYNFIIQHQIALSIFLKFVISKDFMLIQTFELAMAIKYH